MRPPFSSRKLATPGQHSTGPDWCLPANIPGHDQCSIEDNFHPAMRYNHRSGMVKYLRMNSLTEQLQDPTVILTPPP